MHFVLTLNAYIGTILIIILIFAEYVNRYTVDATQKKLFCSLLLVTFITCVTDFFCYLLDGNPGENERVFLYWSGFVFYIFRMFAYHNILLFADYVLIKDTKRLKYMSIAILAINVLHFALLLVNLKLPFYFYVDGAANTIHHGNQYFICMILSFGPMFYAICELLFFRKKFKEYKFLMVLILLSLLLLGVFTDLYIRFGMLILWPFVTAGLLYFYFSVIQNDNSIDSLTGISNRYSFNEFTDKLSQRKTGESWAIVMIDLDHFKSINDRFGHLEGDNALRDMASILKNCIRRNDFIARYGGDEFVLATRAENNIEDLISAAKKEADKLNEKNLRPYKIEISYGYDIYTADGSRPIEEFLNHIDALMYKQKEERRSERRRINDMRGEQVPAGETA
uniref:Diguanylate cyclase/phosphodiesterase (GGDEF & EAL domains) with GAF sensor n=1 Tax=uncultured bacterium contig00073 TaxID=1181552 RepID=A0A806JZ48_9BACT|nr:diguanylate cyclase/phosphodiesterase (GGDEF & EAL domains) with GAF sensor [uncultured bacterium contig00073]